MQGYDDRDFPLRLPPAFDGRKTPPIIVTHGAAAAKRIQLADLSRRGMPAASCRKSRIAKDFVGPSRWNTHHRGHSGESHLEFRRRWQYGDLRWGACACKDGVDDVGYRAPLTEVAAIVPYDTRRVYLTGFSNGVAMSWLAW